MRIHPRPRLRRRRRWGRPGRGGCARGVRPAPGEADEPPPTSRHSAVLQDSRVLVPVVAILGEVEYDDR